MKVLVACEESQTVCKAFRARGHEAYSNDIQECSGGHPEWHLQMDALEAMKLMEWDLMIGFPPCTYLSTVGNRWMDEVKYGEKAVERKQRQTAAKEFFLKLWKASVPRVAIENPKGVMSSVLKPRQIIHPWYFGDNEQKMTCLWLRGLPRLNGNPEHAAPEPKYISPKGKRMFWVDAMIKDVHCKKELAKARSKTFPGIANAMAEQWG